MNSSNKQTDSTNRQTFFHTSQTKNFFALGPTKKVGLLIWFLLAFDNSNSRLTKDVSSYFFQVSEKTQLRDEHFSIQA